MHITRPVLALFLVATGGLLAAQSPAPPQPAETSSVPASTSALPPAAPAAVSPSGLAGWTVVLDPGHGGDDRGVQASELVEAQLTLDIAKRTAASLSAHGARVVLTRESDITMDADARAVRANQTHGHAYLSLHFNRSPRTAATGAEIYTHQPASMADAEPPDAQARTLALVRWDRVQDRHVPAAEHLADLLATALGHRVPVSAMPHQRLPLRPLAGVDAPSVLLELAYLSHPGQAALAATPEFQTAVSEAIIEALSAARRPPDAAR